MIAPNQVDLAFFPGGGPQFPGLSGLLSHGVENMRDTTIEVAAYRLSTWAESLASTLVSGGSLSDWLGEGVALLTDEVEQAVRDALRPAGAGAPISRRYERSC